jgi:hypothetical protein
MPAQINKVVVQDRSAVTPGLVRFSAAAKSRSFVTLQDALPLSVTLVFAPPIASGQCGVATFPGPPPAPACNATGARVTCR